MFNPSQQDVRRFFCQSLAKHRSGSVLTPLEAIALDWILRHPEYQDDLADEEKALQASYPVEQGRTNPFLHLSMHLAIAEQVSIDQPPGIRAVHGAWCERLGDDHAAAHQLMESLGQVVWEAQRQGTPPDTERYLDLMRRGLG